MRLATCALGGRHVVFWNTAGGRPTRTEADDDQLHCLGSVLAIGCGQAVLHPSYQGPSARRRDDAEVMAPKGRKVPGNSHDAEKDCSAGAGRGGRLAPTHTLRVGSDGPSRCGRDRDEVEGVHDISGQRSCVVPANRQFEQHP